VSSAYTFVVATEAAVSVGKYKKKEYSEQLSLILNPHLAYQTMSTQDKKVRFGLVCRCEKPRTDGHFAASSLCFFCLRMGHSATTRGVSYSCDSVITLLNRCSHELDYTDKIDIEQVNLGMSRLCSNTSETKHSMIKSRRGQFQTCFP
jgi:hypothetical protein